MSREKLIKKKDRLEAMVQQSTPGQGRVPTPAEFRQSLLIDHDNHPVPFKPDPWQEADFHILDPGWMQMAGFPVAEKPILRAWEERPRGHAKTSDLAISAAWALTYAPHTIRGIAAASDRDQAAHLRDAIGRLRAYNPALAILDVQSWCVINTRTNSQLDILSSDAPSSYGHLPDFICCDEISHWPEGRGEELWTSLFSAAGKKSSCLLMCICNAGFEQSWCWKVRELIRDHPHWHFSHLDQAQASWISAAALEEQEKLLPPQVYSRLWQNVWSSGAGDALNVADIMAAITLDGPLMSRENGWTYFAAVDLSVRHDHSAIVLIAKRHGDGFLKVCRVMSWKPLPGKEINLQLIQDACVELHNKFHPMFSFDEFQAVKMRQELANKNLWIGAPVHFSGKDAMEMAAGLLETFTSRSIALYPDDDLIRDLKLLRIVESTAGYKLDAPRTVAAGHCDRGVALALAVLGARRYSLPSASTESPFAFGRYYGAADFEQAYGFGASAQRGIIRSFDHGGQRRLTGGFEAEQPTDPRFNRIDGAPW
jgi:hypothetical protein